MENSTNTISRVLLSLETVFYRVQHHSDYPFDEFDLGSSDVFDHVWITVCLWVNSSLWIKPRFFGQQVIRGFETNADNSTLFQFVHELFVCVFQGQSTSHPISEWEKATTRHAWQLGSADTMQHHIIGIIARNSVRQKLWQYHQTWICTTRWFFQGRIQGFVNVSIKKFIRIIFII